MKWVVIDTVIQPTCGISFSAIWGDMKMIIWYQSNIFLPPGSIFAPVKPGIILKDKEYPITIYNNNGRVIRPLPFLTHAEITYS